MRLSELLRDVCVLSEYYDREISTVTDKTADAEQNCAFVCVKGSRADGHKFADEMIKKGAAAVIVNKDLGLKEQIIVDNTRKAYALMCKNLFGRSADRLEIIGITGTNGKSSTASPVRDILKALGIQTGMIGTVKIYAGDETFPATMTTPDPYDIHRLFSVMESMNIKYCIMETTSQALHQMRHSGIHFKVGVFTNLTQDHLDYHKTMEEYKKCKKELFYNCDTAVMNCDDESFPYMSGGINAKIVTYGKSENADLKAENIKLYPDGISYDLLGKRIKYGVPGMFSVYNSLASIGSVMGLGFSLDDIIPVLGEVKAVKGRLEVLKTDTDYSVVIDYAHTPDGFLKALQSVNEFTKNRVITVFGCGGDRDKTKRPKMGRIATDCSDVVIVTTDNPRTEDQSIITKEILLGTVGSKAEVITIEDRTEAITYALKIAQKGDTVLLAGKGHETYQIIGKERRHYDEREVVSRILGKDV